MRLLITTPAAVVVEDPQVTSIRAEDESGSFGILHGHEDFLTALTVSVVIWRSANHALKYCAVRNGVLSVHGGREVAIATRQAIVSDDLDHLEGTVLSDLRDAADAGRRERTESLQIQLRAIRQIVALLHPVRLGGIGVAK